MSVGRAEGKSLRLGVLISGGGRTVLNLADQIDAGMLPATIALVLAHRPDVPGIARCAGRGLPTRVVPPGPTLPDEVDRELLAAQVDLVVLAGYLRHFRVAPLWSGKTINIHPALLPKFGGKGMYGDRVHAAVIAAGERESGCTAHYVDEQYDHGPTILQRRCPVLPGDDVHSLAARVFELEKEALPEAIRTLARSAAGRMAEHRNSRSAERSSRD